MGNKPTPEEEALMERARLEIDWDVVLEPWGEKVKRGPIDVKLFAGMQAINLNSQIIGDDAMIGAAVRIIAAVACGQQACGRMSRHEFIERLRKALSAHADELWHAQPEMHGKGREQ